MSKSTQIEEFIKETVEWADPFFKPILIWSDVDANQLFQWWIYYRGRDEKLVWTIKDHLKKAWQNLKEIEDSIIEMESLDVVKRLMQYFIGHLKKEYKEITKNKDDDWLDKAYDLYAQNVTIEDQIIYINDLWEKAKKKYTDFVKKYLHGTSDQILNIDKKSKKLTNEILKFKKLLEDIWDKYSLNNELFSIQRILRSLSEWISEMPRTSETNSFKKWIEINETMFLKLKRIDLYIGWYIDNDKQLLSLTDEMVADMSEDEKLIFMNTPKFASLILAEIADEIKWLEKLKISIEKEIL